MNLPTQISAYLRAPFRVCDASLAAALAEAGQRRLTAATGVTARTYSIANCLYPAAANAQRLVVEGVELPLVEVPEVSRLAGFYEEHGLEPLSCDELLASQATSKISAARTLLESIPAVRGCFKALVKTIQVLRSPDPEIDVSYSHPAIPFSVFVSVGEDNSFISSLRLAESLLHEAMHLKLTLLEAETALLRAGCEGLYYSPWRDEDRPAQGVLHGMFVFAAVREFYVAQLDSLSFRGEEVLFISQRIRTIEQELAAVHRFREAADLTRAGRLLATNLLGSAVSAGSPLSLLKTSRSRP